MKTHIYHFTKLLALAAITIPLLTSCEKKFDYSRPADANTFENDLKNSFNTLSSNNKNWIWPMTIAAPPFNNEGMGLIMLFRADSTARATLIAKKTIADQLVAAANTGRLTSRQISIVQRFINNYSMYYDWDIRDAFFNYAQFATELGYIREVLPNIVNFSPVITGVVEDGVNYNTNGPIALSLTITNTTLLPMWKQSGVGDFDFRITSYTSNKMDLTGYYTNNSNQKTSLYTGSPADVTTFATGSTMLSPESSLRVGANSIRVNGSVITLPTGFTSGLSLFYQAYRQQFIEPATKFGFSLLSSVTGIPAQLTSSPYYVVKSSYTGAVNTAPSGTVIVTLAGVNSQGAEDGKTVEFVKN